MAGLDDAALSDASGEAGGKRLEVGEPKAAVVGDATGVNPVERLAVGAELLLPEALAGGDAVADVE